MLSMLKFNLFDKFTTIYQTALADDEMCYKGAIASAVSCILYLASLLHSYDLAARTETVLDSTSNGSWRIVTDL